MGAQLICMQGPGTSPGIVGLLRIFQDRACVTALL